MTISLKSSWISSLSEGMGKVQLFCFPYAGGGSAAYYSWRQLLRPEVDLLPVHLPGREHRLREPLLTNFDKLVKNLAENLYPDAAQRPFAFFGHSMGSLVAFEVARELRRRDALVPQHLFLSGFRAPHLSDRDTPCSDLPEAEFIERLRQYEGIPEALIHNEELKEIFLPILRADFKVLESYIFKKAQPFDCPITAFGGISDRKFDREAIDQWRIHTSGKFKAYYYPGDHFFINSSKVQIINRLNYALVSL